MSNKTTKMINEGGDIGFPEIAALAIATALYISQDDDDKLMQIGKIADEIMERFVKGDFSGN